MCSIWFFVPKHKIRSQQYQSAHSAGSFGNTLLQCGHFQYSWITALAEAENMQRHCYLQLVLLACISACVYMAVQIHAKLTVILCFFCGPVTTFSRISSLRTNLQSSHPFIYGWGFVALLVLHIKYCTCPGLWRKGGIYRLLLMFKGCKF